MACIAACLLFWCGVEVWLARLPDEPDPIPVTTLLMALDRLPGPEAGPKRPLVTGPIDVQSLDSAGWVAAGLTPKQAASALRYRAAVGGFVNEEVLRRMRVLPKGWMERYGDQLRFPEPPPTEPTPSKESGRSQQMTTSGEGPSARRRAAAPEEPVDLNRTDSLTLLRMKGVGPWVAGRILEARRKWGGFAAPEQLQEALGWDSLANVLLSRFEANAADVVQRCPDSLSASDWQDIPGVSRKEAEVLALYVSLHGAPGGNVSGCLGVRDSVLRQVAIYLRPCGEK